MLARRAVLLGFASFSIAWVVGCKSAPDAPAPQPKPVGTALFKDPPPSSASPNTPESPPTDAAARALAAKVASYTRDVAPQLDRRAQKPAAAAAAATVPVDASAVVNWLTPEAISLSPFTQESRKESPPRVAAGRTAPAPLTVADAGAPAANQPEMIAHARADGANFPLTIPEGAERPAQPAATPADDFERKLAQRVKDYPRDVEGQLDYQMLLFLRDQPVPQLAAVAGLSPEDREIVAALMDGLSNFRNVVRSDNNMLLGRKIKPLLDMADRLKGQAELSLPTVALCSEVKSFGVYKPVESARFRALADHPVIVYCEVENFSSQANSQSLWETKLTQETVLYTETGLPVWPAKSNAQPVTDVCRNRRHDFFIAKIITLPKNLTIGRYLLKVTVTDQQASRIAEATTLVEIVAE